MKKKTNVLVVEDSIVAREMIKQILESDPEISVVGEAKNGKDAISLMHELSPDLITMDIHMPKMDGIEATEYIMAIKPTPILIVSSSVNEERTSSAFEALKKGALDVLKKPEPTIWNDLAEVGDELINKVKTLSQVTVVKHISGLKKVRTERRLRDAKADYHILAIGSSTGGPNALLEILSTLPKDFPLPVLIAQHITDGFINGMIDWLSQYCYLPLKLAENRDPVSPGTVLISPTSKHMTIDFGGVVKLVNVDESDLYKPSVNKLFESVANVYSEKAIGVILTGMGSDGAQGLKLIRKEGGLTIAQDEESCAVYGMPKAAVEYGAVVKISKIDEISNLLLEAVGSLIKD